MNFLKLCCIIFLQKIALNTFSQYDSLKVGVYRNVFELSKQSPLINNKIEFDHEDYDDPIYSKDNNVYYPKAITGVVTKKTLYKRVGFIYDGENLYVNLFIYGMGKGYSKITEIGKYSFFMGRPVVSREQEKILNKAALYGGLSGLTTAAIIIYSVNKNNIYYVVNLETGVLHYLNRYFMEFILKDYPNLLVEYKNSDNNESPEVILEYLKRYNKLKKFNSLKN